MRRLHLFRNLSVPCLIATMAVSSTATAGLPIHGPQFQPISLGQILQPAEELDLLPPKYVATQAVAEEEVPSKFSSLVNSLKLFPWSKTGTERESGPRITAAKVIATDSNVQLTQSTSQGNRTTSKSRLESLLKRMGYSSNRESTSH